MANLKSLAKDTAIYGLSSIIGRFLNYQIGRASCRERVYVLV